MKTIRWVTTFTVCWFLLACNSDINFADKQASFITSDDSGFSEFTDNQSNEFLNNDKPFSWTTFTPSPDSRMIYVSSSSLGKDSNDGLSPATPKKSVAAGLAMLRDGYPDHLMFKRGDVFIDEPLKTPDGFALSGRSVTEPMVITYYGDEGALPLFKTGKSGGFRRWNNSDQHDLAIVGLHFIAQTRNPHSNEYSGPDGEDGFTWGGAGHVERITLEGCRFDYYPGAVVIQTFQADEPFHDLKLRGNVFYFSWYPASKGHAQGGYIYDVDGLEIEGNYFIHNAGLNNYPNDPDKIVPPGLTLQDATADWYGHALYLDHPTTNVVLRNNVVMGGDGIQCRTGCTALDNLFLRTIVGIAGGNDDNGYQPGGVSAIIKRNVFAEGTDWPVPSGTAGPRAFGIEFTNINADPGADFSWNVFLNDASLAPHGFAIHLNGSKCNSSAGSDCKVRRAKVANNIVYNWRGGFWLEGIAGTEILNTTISSNIIYDQKSTDVPLMRLLSSYSGSGVSWNNNGYFRAGSADNWFQNGNSMLSLVNWQSLTQETAATQYAGGPSIDYDIMDIAKAYALPVTSFTELEEYFADQSPIRWDANVEAGKLNFAYYQGYGLIP